MRVALFSDIHANREAFEASLVQARGDGAEQIVLLGDYVGYGADPDWCVTTVMELADGGAVVLKGNHDSAVDEPRLQMNAAATAAMEWTRGQLGQAQRLFLANLPLVHEEQDRLYVHADASRPADWNYVLDAGDAAHSLQATPAQITVCGHVHRPALYSMSTTGKMTSFTPITDVPIRLLSGRQWLAVLGSVGQPRDGDPAASYAMLDTAKRELTYRRAPYDIDTAASKIRAQGLPSWLADRLFAGR
jgi:diadenosine tetraphosphatase ApaH/serine/threonine PP2A family protein phosphatase